MAASKGKDGELEGLLPSEEGPQRPGGTSKMVYGAALVMFVAVLVTKFFTEKRDWLVGLQAPPFAKPEPKYEAPFIPLPHDPTSSIRRDCGRLCAVGDASIRSPGKWMDQVKTTIDCQALYKNELIDQGSGVKKPPAWKELSEEVQQEFLLGGKIKLKHFFLNDIADTMDRVKVWKSEDLENDAKKCLEGKLGGTYGVKSTNDFMDGLRHASTIKGGRVLVIGSQKPWIEACLLGLGAAEVVTLEFARIDSRHEKVKPILPDDFRKGYLDGSLNQFDAIATYSSVEHTGLARYGDSINPWGDIITIARAFCVTKPGGHLIIGVPTVNPPTDKDSVFFNAHRYYGPIRWPHLVTNWEQVYRTELSRSPDRPHGYVNQEVYVLTRD